MLNLCKINNSDFVVNMEAGLGDIHRKQVIMM